MHFTKLLLATLWIWPIAANAESADSLNNTAIRTEATLIVDNVTNWMGGIEKGNSMLGLLDFALTVHPSHLHWLHNTLLHVHFLKTTGETPSEKYIGDAQVASNIEGRTSRFVYEMYLQQTIGKVTLTAGLHDLNAELMYSENAGHFINSSFGIFPSVSLNMPVSIFPVTSFGVLANYQANNWGVSVACYNLNHDYIDENTFSFANHLYQKGYLAVTEINYRAERNKQHTSNYKIGAVYNKYKSTLSDTLASRQTNCYGFYLVSDQDICHISKMLLKGFLQLCWTQSKQNHSPFYGGVGIQLVGIASKALPNHLGLAYGHVRLRNENMATSAFVNTHEQVIELMARFSINDHIHFEPDIQYIIQPSGVYNNALVTVLRFIAELN